VAADEDETPGVRFTRQELEALAACGALWDRLVALPPLHPDERAEVRAAVHRVQDMIIARPGMRALGWPRILATVADADDT
jgi:hypothetical protein